VPSDEIYAAMQTGSLDAAVTSSSSLISFRLQEVSKNVTTGRGGSFWFMLEPLLMSKTIFDSLTPEEQKAVTEVGESLEPFALQSAKADDDELAKIYKAAGIGVKDMTAADLKKWRTIAQDSAWKDFAARSEACANLLKLAQSVPA
jgi:TRAP-type C4-dicarboxylate transport system substrate-binding protein